MWLRYVYLLRYTAVYSTESRLTFRRNISLPYSGLKKKPSERPCHINYDFYGTDYKDGHIGGTAIAVKKDIPHTCIDLLPLLSVTTTGAAHRLEILKCLFQLFITTCKNCGVTQMSWALEIGPSWQMTSMQYQLSSLSGLKILQLLVSSDLEI